MKPKHAEHPRQSHVRTKKPRPDRRVSVAPSDRSRGRRGRRVSAVFSPALLGVRRIAARATLCATPPG